MKDVPVSLHVCQSLHMKAFPNVHASLSHCECALLSLNGRRSPLRDIKASVLHDLRVSISYSGQEGANTQVYSSIWANTNHHMSEDNSNAEEGFPSLDQEKHHADVGDIR